MTYGFYKKKSLFGMLEIYPTRLEAPSRVPLPSVLLFDFIAMVCFHEINWITLKDFCKKRL